MAYGTMAYDSTYSYGARTVMVYSAFTCIYIPLILIYLIYIDKLYNIGNFNCLSLLIVLIIMECMKLGLGLVIKNISYLPKDTKPLKVKKSCGKLKIKEIFKSVLSMFLITAIYFLIAIFFGAPVLTDHEETLMISLLVMSLTVFPGCINVGVDVTLSLLAGLKPMPGDLVMEMIQRNMQCTIFGTWTGAVVIPLDWDRPWQVWPIPCCLGAIFGYILGHILMLIKLMPYIAKNVTRKNQKCI